MRRRSISIFVSPGPRPPMPAPPAARPPTWRDSDSPHPRSRGSRYCICASSTCALPSLDRACCANMSRMSAVRSTTFTLTISSSWRSWPGVSSPSQITVSAPGPVHDVAELLSLARADVGRRVRPITALDQPVENLGARCFGEPSELDQRVLRVHDRAGRPHSDEDDPLEAQLPVLDLGDVCEFGGQPGHPPQRLAIGKLVAAGGVRRSLRARGEKCCVIVIHRDIADRSYTTELLSASRAVVSPAGRSQLSSSSMSPTITAGPCR